MLRNRRTKIAAAAALAVLIAGCGGSQPPAKESTRTEAPPQPAKITAFYPAVPQAAPGEAVTVCYGVENATDVRLDPPVENLSPSFNRCFQVSAKSTTTYTLHAKGKDGKEVSQAFTLPVRAKAAQASSKQLIAFFGATKVRIAPGEQTSLCYSVLPGTKFHITPKVDTPDSPTTCVTVQPAKSTTYTMEATGPNGATDAVAVKIQVGAQ